LLLTPPCRPPVAPCAAHARARGARRPPVAPVIKITRSASVAPCSIGEGAGSGMGRAMIAEPGSARAAAREAAHQLPDAPPPPGLPPPPENPPPPDGDEPDELPPEVITMPPNVVDPLVFISSAAF